MKRRTKIKQCACCKQRKEISYFHKDSHAKDKVKGYCKECTKITRRPSLRRYYIKNHYGLTELEYEDLFIRQGGKCAICETHQETLKRGLHIDHNHKTGEVRGLLCFACNAGLGLFKDKRGRLFRAIQYLGNRGEEI